MASLHRCVGGEYAFLGGCFAGIFKGMASGHFLTHQFERQECCMTFIHMEDRRLNIESAHESHTADTQKHFLHDACCTVATINPQCEFPIMLFIFRQISVHKVNRNTSHIDPPDFEFYLAGRNLNHASEVFPFCIKDRFHGQILRIETRIVFRLPVFLIDRLHEVALSVKKADANKRKSQVTCRFRVIPCKNTQSTCCDWKCFM